MLKNRSRILLLGLVVVLAFSGCDILGLLNGLKDKVEEDLPQTFAEELIEELGASLDEASGRSARALTLSLELSAGQVSAIKAAALLRIKNAGLENSVKLDELIPLMLEGVKQGIESLRVETAEDFSPVLVVAARSAISSASQAGRESNTTEGVTISEVIVMSVETAAAQINVITVGAQTASLMSEVTTAVIEAIDASNLGTSDAAAAISEIVAELAASAATNGDSGALAAVMASARTAIEAADADIDSAAVLVDSAAAAVTAVAAATDATTAADFVATIAAEVPSAQTEIETAATNASVSTANISTAIAEPAVSALAQVQLGSGAFSSSVTITTEANKTVTLSSSGSTGAYLSWSQVAGPGAGSSISALSFDLTAPGSYIYELTVKNSEAGYKSASARVAVYVQSFVMDQAASFVQQGIQYLAARNFSAARSAFGSALLKDPANTQAKVWKAVLDTAALSVDSTAVTLFKDRMGFIGYPSTLNAYLSDTWFTDQWYGEKIFTPISGSPDPVENELLWVRGEFFEGITGNTIYYRDFETGQSDVGDGYFLVSDSGPEAIEFFYDDNASTWRTFEVDATGFDISYSAVSSLTKYDHCEEGFHDLLNPLAMLPEVRAPSWAPSLGPRKTLTNYPLYIVANIIDRNPAGLNTILDTVLAGPFGSALDSILDSIEALPDEAEVIVPESLIAAYTGELSSAPLLIGKAELLAYAGQLRTFKAILQLIASYNFSYPLSALKLDAFFFGDSGFDKDDEYPPYFDTIMPLAKGPLVISSNTKLLENRSQTQRDAARQNLVKGLEDIITAASDLSLGLASDKYLDFIPPELGMTGDDLSALVDTYVTDAANLKAAVQTSTTAFPITMGYDEFDNPVTSDSYPGLIFDSAVFSFPNLFEYETVGEIQRPVLYATTGHEEEVEPLNYEFVTDSYMLWDEAIAPDATFAIHGYALKLNVSALAELWPDVVNMLPYPPVGGEYYLPLGGDLSFDRNSVGTTPGFWLFGYGPGGN